MKTLVVVALLLTTPVVINAQSKPLVLKNRIRTDVSLANSGILLPTACDEEGRSYVMPDEREAGSASLLRISSKGTLEAMFDMTNALMQRYAVRPNGGVALVQMDAGQRIIENFGANGRQESAITLEKAPIPLFPDQVAVFRSGQILMSGPARRGSKASTVIYDPAGHLVKQFVLDGDADIEHDAQSRSIAASGDDGLVYLMRATSPARVYAISATGEVVRKIIVSSPTGMTPPKDMRVQKGRVAVTFYAHCTETGVANSCHGIAYVVVDATTGQRLADYTAEGEVAGILACYAPDPDRFFTFSIMPGEHRLDIVEAAGR